MKPALIALGAAAGVAALLLSGRANAQDTGAEDRWQPGDAAPPVSQDNATDGLFDQPGRDESAMIAGQNMSAFLRALRVGEGSSDANGYRRLVGGGEFQSFAVHPSENLVEFPPGGPRSFTRGGFYVKQFDSTAAGAYQITWTTWKDFKRRFPGRFNDFMPDTQDDFARSLIELAGATDDVSAGRILPAVFKVKGRWESLPGSGTRPKNEVTLAGFINSYQSAGGVYV